MMVPKPDSHPVLSCEAAGAWEQRLFGGDEVAERRAMGAAGRALACAIEQDAAEIGGLPVTARILVLAGKGHNAGDALIAANALLATRPAATVTVAFVLGERGLRPLARCAWRDLSAGGAAITQLARIPDEGVRYDLVIDGVFGFSYRPPLLAAVVAWLRWANAVPARMRVAVDLPSGLDEAEAFRADFTYATGLAKTPLLGQTAAGRLRYLDIGFFDDALPEETGDRVLVPAVLAPLRAGRPAASDKRSYGHVLLIGGSRIYPGAIMLATQAALRSGVGLVTAAVPETLAAAYAAAVPEVMWVGCPETPDGGLALEAAGLIRARAERATAWVIGPGLGRERESLALAAELLKGGDVPVVLDADALQVDLVSLGDRVRVLTPHAGEFARIAGERGLREFATANRVTVLKGPTTQICAGGVVWHSFTGGPVLARGGSGDVLAGLIGGLLAQTPKDPALAARRGVYWHGLAADHLARTHGQVAVRTLELIEALGPALREG